MTILLHFSHLDSMIIVYHCCVTPNFIRKAGHWPLKHLWLLTIALSIQLICGMVEQVRINPHSLSKQTGKLQASTEAKRLDADDL